MKCEHCTKQTRKPKKGLCRACWGVLEIRVLYEGEDNSMEHLLRDELNKEEQHRKQIEAKRSPDEMWIDSLLRTKAATKLKDLGGRSDLDSSDIYEFFGDPSSEMIAIFRDNLRNVEQRETVPQSKINFCRIVADALVSRLASPCLFYRGSNAKALLKEIEEYE